MTNQTCFQDISMNDLEAVNGGIKFPTAAKWAFKAGGVAALPYNLYTDYKSGQAGANAYFNARAHGENRRSSLKAGVVGYVRRWL